MAQINQAELEKIAQDALSNAQDFLTNSPNRKREKPSTRITKDTNTAPQNEVVTPEVVASSNTGGFGVRTNIPSISEQDYTQRYAAIQGQMRAQRLNQENLKLDKEVAVSQGLQAEVSLQQTKNLITGEKAVTESIKLNQQQTRTELERVKLQSIELDVSGERALLQPKQELNQIRLEGAQIDVNGSRTLLEPQRQKWALQLESAELKLLELRGQIQRQRAALGTGTPSPLTIEQID